MRSSRIWWPKYIAAAVSTVWRCRNWRTSPVSQKGSATRDDAKVRRGSPRRGRRGDLADSDLTSGSSSTTPPFPHCQSHARLAWRVQTRLWSSRTCASSSPGLRDFAAAGARVASASPPEGDRSPGLVVEFVGGFRRADILDLLTLASRDLTGDVDIAAMNHDSRPGAGRSHRLQRLVLGRWTSQRERSASARLELLQDKAVRMMRLSDHEVNERWRWRVGFAALSGSFDSAVARRCLGTQSTNVVLE